MPDLWQPLREEIRLMITYEPADRGERDKSYERNFYLEKIANELAESNRLKRIELDIRLYQDEMIASDDKESLINRLEDMV